MARQTVTMERPHCDDCDTNLLTHAAWLTTADGAELCISCGEARERAEAAAARSKRPAWLDDVLEELEPAPAPALPDFKTRALLDRVDALLEQCREREMLKS